MNKLKMNNNSKQKNHTQTMALIGVMTAVTCILGPLSIPIGPVPISFTNLAIYLAIYILGKKKGTFSVILYLLIGLVGVPVFSQFSGGPAKLFGPTGGYLIGFIAMAVISGFFFEKFHHKYIYCVFGMILGTLVTYLLGTAWLAYHMGLSFYAALMAGVIPFLPGDAAKIIIASIAGPAIKKPLAKAGLMSK